MRPGSSAELGESFAMAGARTSKALCLSFNAVGFAYYTVIIAVFEMYLVRITYCFP